MKALLAVIFCLLLFPWAAQSSDLYRWTDESGVTHVTDQPPSETAKNVKTYRSAKPPEPVATEPKADGETSGAIAEGKPVPNQQGQDINQELEQARADYEEAKSHEAEIQFNYKKAYGSSWDRKFWREKLDDIEKKRQRVENLEKGINAGEDKSLPSPSENPEER